MSHMTQNRVVLALQAPASELVSLDNCKLWTLQCTGICSRTRPISYSSLLLGFLNFFPLRLIDLLYHDLNMIYHDT